MLYIIISDFTSGINYSQHKYNMIGGENINTHIDTNIDYNKMKFPEVSTLTNAVIQQNDIHNFVWLEKTDGLHQIIVINNTSIYSLRKNPDKEPTYIPDVIGSVNNTKFSILDCELYKDTYNVFDCPYALGRNVCNEPYETRMEHAKEVVDSIKSNVKFNIKEFKQTTNIEELIEFLKNDKSPFTNNTIDGVVLQHKTLPYFGSKQPIVYKLKRPTLNTIDFRLKLINNVFYLNLYGSFRDVIYNRKILPLDLMGIRKGHKIPDSLDIIWCDPYGLTPMTFSPVIPDLSMYTDEQKEVIKKLINSIKLNKNKYNNVIFEMSFNPVSKSFVPLRIRDDKLHPNGYSVGLSNAGVLFNPVRPSEGYFAKEFAFGPEVLNPYHQINQLIRKYELESEINSHDINPKFNNVLDLAGGRGADLITFYNSGITNIFAQDADKDALVQYVERSSYTPRQDYIFLLSNSVKPKMSNRILINAVFGFLGPDNSEIINDIKSRREYPNDGFDLIVMNYAVHYLCDNTNSLKELNKLIHQLLKERGMFIFTYFDGDKILSNMKDNKLELTTFTITTYDQKTAMMALPTIDKTGYRNEPLVRKEHIELVTEGLSEVYSYHPLEIETLNNVIKTIPNNELVTDYLRYIKVGVYTK